MTWYASPACLAITAQFQDSITLLVNAMLDTTARVEPVLHHPMTPPQELFVLLGLIAHKAPTLIFIVQMEHTLTTLVQAYAMTALKVTTVLIETELHYVPLDITAL